ncbi:penicillin acylase family protein [Tsuneonella mangrovi]|uniref:penicillin acylase family protein n=1 Tax=Tsuneonella mangrovi TaxID=1982042 RepID=UPI000BA1DD22|nr:acylase [Tsuneonella mangrovi]
MKTWIVRTSWLVVVVGLTALIALMTWEPLVATPGKAPPPHAYRAEIVRDEFGVPHIHGHTDADVAYGVAIAHSQDDFSTLQDVLAMTRGRYGAIAGEDGAKVDYALALLDARGTADRQYMTLRPDTRALLEAYATGLNDYAKAHPREIKLANLFPVDGRDIATGFALRQPFFFGLGNTIGPLVAGTPLPLEHGPALGNAPASSPKPSGEPNLNGSNAFAVAPARSGDGVTRLVSNSHQPWTGPVAWYELVVQSDEGWHFAGATFPGSPFPFLGHNEDLGWTNTVNSPDMTDIYKLVLNADGTKYRMDGKWLPLEKRSVRLPVRFGPLVLPIDKTVYASIHGPVIENKNGAFAFRYGGMGSIAQLDAYYDLNKAKTYDQWHAILARHAIPSTNFIYADKAGNIAYWYNASIPLRKAGPDWRGVLPGDRSDLIWHKLVPYDSLPHYFDPKSGFLFNSNNTPFHAAGKQSDLSPDSVPPQMGVELRMTNRARRAEKLLDATDPIGPLELKRIKYDTGWERAGYVRQVLDAIAALDVRDNPRLAQAQKLMGEWDLDSDGKGPADALADLVMFEPMVASYDREPLPPARELLDHASAHLLKYFGRLDPPLSDVLRIRRGPGPYAVDLPMDGGSDTLRAATSWNVGDDGRLAVKHGDSFIMFVEWAPGKPVSSQSIVPFGAATTRPDNVHFTDQAALFSQHKLKPVHFFWADVEKYAVDPKVYSHQR